MALHGLHMPMAATGMRVFVGATWKGDDDEVITKFISDGTCGLPACASISFHWMRVVKYPVITSSGCSGHRIMHRAERPLPSRPDRSESQGCHL